MGRVLSMFWIRVSEVKAFAFEQQSQRFQHVRLIVGDEDPGPHRTHHRLAGRLVHHGLAHSP
jgi:hypothetical protein